MSILKGTVSKNAAGAASDKPMLTPEQFVEQLHALREQIPEFAQLPRNEVRQMRNEASVTVEFAHEAINAIGSSEVVQNVIGGTPAELHQAEDELARWQVAENELRSMLRGVIVANILRRRRLGRVATQVYNISRELVREDGHAQLLPHVEAMSRIRRFTRRRRKPPSEPTPPQAPQQQAPQQQPTQQQQQQTVKAA